MKNLELAYSLVEIQFLDGRESPLRKEKGKDMWDTEEEMLTEETSGLVNVGQ